FNDHGPLFRSKISRNLAAGAGAQRLERLQRCAFAQELHGAIGESEVGAARMTASEGAEPVEHRGQISPERPPIADRHWGAEGYGGHDPLGRHETPFPMPSQGKCSGQNNGLADVEFRITMVALAEQKRGTAAVGDVRNANVAPNPEEAVPGHVERTRKR